MVGLQNVWFSSVFLDPQNPKGACDLRRMLRSVSKLVWRSQQARRRGPNRGRAFARLALAKIGVSFPNTYPKFLLGKKARPTWCLCGLWFSFICFKHFLVEFFFSPVARAIAVKMADTVVQHSIPLWRMSKSCARLVSHVGMEPGQTQGDFRGPSGHA